MGFLSSSKDRMVESMAMPMLNNSLLKPYGKATAFKLNSSEKSASIILELKGETQPVEIHLTSYELLPEDDHVFLIVRGISTSREWLTNLANEHLVGKKLELPEQAASYAGSFL